MAAVSLATTELFQQSNHRLVVLLHLLTIPTPDGVWQIALGPDPVTDPSQQELLARFH